MIDHVAYLCAQHADRRSPAVAAGLDQVEAVIRDELDEAGVGPDNPIFDRHAVIVLNLIYELARRGHNTFKNPLQALEAAVTTSALVFGDRASR